MVLHMRVVGHAERAAHEVSGLRHRHSKRVLVRWQPATAYFVRGSFKAVPSAVHALSGAQAPSDPPGRSPQDKPEPSQVAAARQVPPESSHGA